MTIDDNSVLEFEDCELRLATQELFRSGRGIDVEPKALLLLRYLIENRERTISKDELLANVWKTIHISEGVVARAVMKLRRALGDSDEIPRLLRTQHRIGYRFIAPVTVRPGLQPSGNAGTAPAAPSPRLAVLPVRNLTGDATRAWAELGLMGLVHRSLESAGINLAPLADTLVACDGIGAAASVSESIFALRQKLGVERVVAMEASHGGQGLDLYWALWQADVRITNGREEGQDLVVLAMAATDRMVATLHDADRGGPAGSCDLGDAFLNESFLRSQTALLEGRFDDALAFITVCLSAPRRPLELEIAHLSVLSELRERQALALGETILARVDDQAPVVPRILTRLRLAQICQYFGELARAAELLEQSAQLLASSRSYGLFQSLEYLRAAVGARAGRIDRAREHALGAYSAAEAAGDHLLATRLAMLLTQIEERAGNTQRVLGYASAATERARRFGFTRDLLLSLTNQAEIRLTLGEVESAQAMLSQCAGLSTRAVTSQIARRSAWLDLCIGLLKGQQEGVEARIARLRVCVRPGSLPDRETLQFSLAQCALEAGDLGAANRAIDELEAIVPRPEGDPGLMALRVGARLREARFDDAALAIGAFEAATRRQQMPFLEGLALGARAQWLYALGDLEGALERAERAVALLPSPTTGVRAAFYPTLMDAIWIALECRASGAGLARAGELEAWFTGTVRAREVDARVHYEAGDFTGALVRQRRFLESGSGSMASAGRETLAIYETAHRRGRREPLPRRTLTPCSA